MGRFTIKLGRTLFGWQDISLIRQQDISLIRQQDISLIRRGFILLRSNKLLLCIGVASLDYSYDEATNCLPRTDKNLAIN